MKNRKLLNIITTGLIAFSLTTQTVSAAVPFALEFVTEEESQLNDEHISLSQVIAEESDLTLGEFLSNTYFTYHEDNKTLYMIGDLPEGLSYKIVVGDQSEELAGEFHLEFSNLDSEGKLELKLLSESDTLQTMEIEFKAIIDKFNEVYASEELEELEELEDIIVDEEEEAETVLDQEPESENNTEANNEELEELDTSAVTSQVEAEKESDTSIDEEKASEVSVEEVPEYTYDIDFSNEETTSMPRFQEVEEMLHGQEEVPMTFMARSFMTTSSTRTHVNGVYTVVSGDNFNAIATSFGLSATQLRHWNTHITNTNNITVGTRIAVTRQGVESMLSQADKDRLRKGGGQAEFTTPQEFINFIAPMAIEVANQEGVQGLYPSLMIAQAAHESNYGRSSLGAPPYHNLSGIKGNHNGNSVLMWTWEVFSGVRVDVLAGFRHYPSYTASLQDYANLLRNGLSWNRNYYSGTWRSNTKDVWDVLANRGLAGYATDPAYYDAMRRVINQYDLTQYDSGNYYVRTGTFFGENATKNNMNRMKTINPNMVYRYEQSSTAPYRNRRVETTNEFVGEAAAQRAVNDLKADQGWHSSYRQTNNSTNHVRVQSGFFNTRARAERAVEEFREETGWYATIEAGNDGRFRLRTGFYVGEESAQRAFNHMENLGWFARTVETGESTPHYVVYTGVFPNPSAVGRAHTYFNSRGWTSRETMVNRNTYYYRVFVEGFPSQTQANTFVSTLSSRFGWHSAAFPLN